MSKTQILPIRKNHSHAMLKVNISVEDGPSTCICENQPYLDIIPPQPPISRQCWLVSYITKFRNIQPSQIFYLLRMIFKYGFNPLLLNPIEPPTNNYWIPNARAAFNQFAPIASKYPHLATLVEAVAGSILLRIPLLPTNEQQRRALGNQYPLTQFQLPGHFGSQQPFWTL